MPSSLASYLLLVWAPVLGSVAPPLPALSYPAQLLARLESVEVAATSGSGSSPVLRRTLLRRSTILLASFHRMPESSTAMATSGRPVVVCQAVCTGWPPRDWQEVIGLGGHRSEE